MALRLRSRDLLLPIVVLVPALLAVLAGPATAQSGPPTPQAAQMVQQACGADIQKLCAGVQPGGGRILQCMKAHASEMSSGCSATLLSLKAERGQ